MPICSLGPQAVDKQSITQKLTDASAKSSVAVGEGAKKSRAFPGACVRACVRAIVGGSFPAGRYSRCGGGCEAEPRVCRWVGES